MASLLGRTLEITGEPLVMLDAIFPKIVDYACRCKRGVGSCG